MSHFYNKKSYSFAETDEMLTDIRKEMSNFITKEDAELLINRRNAIIDPIPYQEHKIYHILMDEIKRLSYTIDELNFKIDKLTKDGE